MTYKSARIILEMQDRNIRRISGTRTCYNGYEYRMTYSGGFAPLIFIDRRRIGRRQFEDFGSVDACHLMSLGSAMRAVEEYIQKRGNENA